MEGAPFIPEYKSDDLEGREKHIPKAETIGSFMVEANPEKDPDYRRQSSEHLGKALISKEALSEKTEIDFEKDPIMRRQQRNNAARVSASLGGLLTSTDTVSDTDTQFVKEQNGGAAQTKPTSTAKRQWSVTDIVMISVILLLLLLIIIVILVKG